MGKLVLNGLKRHTFKCFIVRVAKFEFRQNVLLLLRLLGATIQLHAFSNCSNRTASL